MLATTTIKEVTPEMMGTKLPGQTRDVPAKVSPLPFPPPRRLTIALGEGWPKHKYAALVAEAVAFEPTFWRYDVARAHSLLPRWHGEPGDWEAYAERAGL